MRHWNKTSLAICCVLGWLIWEYGLLTPVVASNGGVDARTFLGLIAQISATMLGFLLAALAILASISGHRLVRNMQKTGHYRVLLHRFFVNVIAYGWATAVALVAYMVRTNLVCATLLALLAFLYASLLLIDLGWRFWLVLTHLGQDVAPPSNGT